MPRGCCRGWAGVGLLILVEAVVADVVPPSRRALVLSVIGAVFAAASIGGPVVGGGLTDSVGWRSVFWLNVPLGLAAAFAVWRWLPASAGARRSVRVDVPGTVCLAVAVVAAVLIPSRRLADQREPLGTDGLGSRQSTGAR